MRVLCCCDKFKGTVTAAQANMALGSALLKRWPDMTVQQLCLSDGGEGFLDSLAPLLALELRTVIVTGPLGDRVPAKYGYRHDMAVVEMANASGMQLVAPDRLNPLRTTSKGTGELIWDAYSQGCRHILLGIGGSATNDAGLGALEAMGIDVFDEAGPMRGPFKGEDMAKVARLSYGPNAEKFIETTRLDIACDVSNPFLGPLGAVAVFSAQKGASPDMQAELEVGMEHMARAVHELTGKDISKTRGCGAAGGIGGAFSAVLNAHLLPGMEVVGEAVGLRAAIASADCVITGEGCYDEQTAKGKVVSWVTSLCHELHVPCIVVCGQCHVSRDDLTHTVHDLSQRYGLQQAMASADWCLRQLIADTAHTFPGIEPI